MKAPPSTHLRRAPPPAAVPIKRRKLKPPPPPAASPCSTPPPPPSPLLAGKADPSAPWESPTRSPTTRRSLAASFCSSSSAASPPVGDGRWEPLGIPRSELSLSLTLPTGQTFRWRKTGPDQFTGVVGPHLLSLRHDAGDEQGGVAFLLHCGGGGGANAADPARAALRDYLNLGVSLAGMWRSFASADARFAELARRLAGGVRVLRQDPVECLFQFLCSSNNNIARIERMVAAVSAFGEHLGTVEGVDFHRFPSIDRLAEVSEEQLRKAGFGYRAKFIVNTVKALRAKPGGGAEWLHSLRGLELTTVTEALCTLPGVGPKVAACVALFSLDQHHAIPVDTHVWQIATRELTPEFAGCRLSPKHFGRVSEAFVDRFGRYAGWAQTALFVGELPPQKALLPPPPANVKKATKPRKEKLERGRRPESPSSPGSW
ncbi:unnamed protein product [Spirodela intermedia]|uniref:DNA-(apurinic or apyrimidinic site) lyase n=1 Tax=Spirodela intermedia TaxID=51605 RepID=A0A7I8KTN9_SPIIN|nr:unnamed protein product [Spirodela intermedia]